MESLITKLEKEAGLSSEQAQKAISCIRAYMKDNDLEIDWDDFLEHKAKKLSDTAKNAWNEFLGKNQTLGDKVEDWTEKAQDTLDSLTDKAKQTLKEARNKAADFISDKE